MPNTFKIPSTTNAFVVLYSIYLVLSEITALVKRAPRHKTFVGAGALNYLKDVYKRQSLSLPTT